jgi:hypothetical protein
MRCAVAAAIGVSVLAAAAAAQTSSDDLKPVATMKQLMLDVIHPASNSLLLLNNRGGPADEKGWAEARRSAMTLAESGNLLIMRNRAAEWVADARLLTDVGLAAYRAASDKDARSLAALGDRLDSSCTTCHTHFRPTVFPRAR